MGNPTWYHDGLHCCVCGMPLKPSSTEDVEMFSADHVVPKSIGKDAVPERLQAMCKRCNTLKADHYPTALLYRLLGSFRALEERHPSLLVRSITVKDLNSIDRVYKVHTACGMCFEVSTNGEPIRCRIDLMEKLGIVAACSYDLLRLNEYILYGSLNLGDNSILGGRSSDATSTDNSTQM